MRFNIYGRFVLEIEREQGRWVPYRTGAGVRREEYGIVIPANLEEKDLIDYLEDLLHELATPGTSITILN